MNFNNYTTDGFYDELFLDNGEPREQIDLLINQINSLPTKDLKRRQKAAEAALMQMGITFNVYGDKDGSEKIFPTDIIPRIIDGDQWDKLEKGLEQRIKALNLFISDIYNEGNILKDQVIPRDLIESTTTYLKEMKGFRPPKDIWIHITGTDVIRDNRGDFMVLEDNLRCPSGVSYLLENRSIMKKTFPIAFKNMKVRPVANYSDHLLSTLQSISLNQESSPNVVVLTPGPYNSAYFEHSYLAQQMGVQLVEGRDLVVDSGFVYMKTTKGFEKVDVIYRRIDDEFLDPETFRKDSLLGVPGLMKAYLSGGVALANAPGTGIADDKAVYAYTPQIIKYYLNEEPLLPIVPTYICAEKKQLDYVLQNLDKLVVKAVNLSGGYGMLIGSQSTKEEQDKFALLLKESPRNYIAQPIISLSRSPVIVGDSIEGRHVDCRPYILYGDKIKVIPGGLTRVALRKGSLVVNSSQGGGSKDTWVLEKRGSHA